MPEITKEVVKPKAKPAKLSAEAEAVWDQVADLADVDKGGLHVSLFGRGKTGKTRFISTFPKPILLIGSEDGTRSIRGIPGIQFIKLKKSDDIAPLAKDAERRGFKTVGVDTASNLQDLILKEICGLDEIPEQLSWGTATREQYGAVTLQIKTLLRMVLDTRLHVVITAHERNFTDESGAQDLLIPSIGSALSPSVTNWLNGAVDYICQTFIRKETRMVNKTVGGKPQQVRMETGKKEYCMRLAADPIYMTGFRVPPGASMPDLIVNPTFEQVNEIAQGKWKPPAKPVAASVKK